jgi:hypothetical protein
VYAVVGGSSFAFDWLVAVHHSQSLHAHPQLPFNNYSTVHCSHGWADGEFFQGGWGCHGGAVTTNDPPELLNIESDSAEEYALLTTDEWQHHLLQQRKSLSPVSPLWQLRYYADTGALPTCDGDGTNATLLPNTSLDGYAGASLSDEASPAQLLDTCRARCCNDSACVAFVVQPHSHNTGKPDGSCAVGMPCCWLVDAEGVRAGNQVNPNATAGYVRSSAPGPPSPPPAGPYADVLRAIDALVAEHMRTMVREVIPGNPHAGLSPCCSSNPSAGVCTCNYPSKTPP